MTTFVIDLYDQMLAHGIKPPTIEHKEGFVRFKSAGICRSRCCYYAIFRQELGAIFGCWRRAISVKWFAKDKSRLTWQEQTQLNSELAFYKKQRAEKQKQSIAKAKTIWQNATYVQENHPYLIKKQIIPYYAKQDGDDLIIPICNKQGTLQSIQRIQPDGFKLFLEGASIKGGCLILSETITSVIYICEGYATGCSIYEATLNTVIVAFGASNLGNISEWIKTIYPHHTIIICADNDNVGLSNAKQAAATINAQYISPDFSAINNATAKHTDFNDLHILAGLDAVTVQLTNKGLKNNDREKTHAA